MSKILPLEEFSIGVGDRFGLQGAAQLRACVQAAQRGVIVVPVWNKSHREHSIIGSQPAETRSEADAAVRSLGWRHPYHVDADHVRRETVEAFIPHSDFFTIDVADYIAQPADQVAIEQFCRRHQDLARRHEIPGLERPLEISRADVEQAARKYFLAINQAGILYRHIASIKGADRFITEVSMDETEHPQRPAELLIILAALAQEGVPLQTIAPKFSGRFNKGVDYVGELALFEREFADDIAVLAYSVQAFGLPPGLKLSVHSGSDKFSIYPVMRRALARTNSGIHLKTAGTTWLEELIGLAESGGEALVLVKDIYTEAVNRRDELCAPYAAVIDIDPAKLPGPASVAGWTSEEFVSALRHDPQSRAFNPHFRQLLHVAYKLAARMGRRYLNLVMSCEPAVARNVTANLFERHLKPLFL